MFCSQTLRQLNPLKIDGSLNALHTEIKEPPRPGALVPVVPRLALPLEASPGLTSERLFGFQSSTSPFEVKAFGVQLRRDGVQ